MQKLSLCDRHQRAKWLPHTHTVDKQLHAYPLGCPTCHRINIERDVVTRTIDALLAAGYALATDEGDHRFFAKVTPSTDRDAVLATLMESDDEFIGVFEAEKAGKTRIVQPIAWVRFVYGNDGYDVISDYTTNLETVLAPINAYTNSLQ